MKKRSNTNLTHRETSEAFTQRDLSLTEDVVKQLLSKHKYVKRKMQKAVTMEETKNRNEQFEKKEKLREEYNKSENPM